VKIEKYSFGSITIDGKEYDNDLILSWDGEIQERIRSHEFKKSELYEILQKSPEIVIIGTGYSGMIRVDPEVEELAKSEGVRLIIKLTREAMKDFNKLSRSKKVVAMMHLTC